ncbi:MAG TPA: biotin synthase BioB [Aquifex sp.]|nr:biotin synthase BioB [Aquifex sp.]
MVYHAGKVKKYFFGNEIEFCSIVNAKSGACSEDCKFCAQSRHYNTKVPVYTFLEEEKILKGAEFAQKIGARHYSLVLSGRSASDREIDKMGYSAQRIKEKFPKLKLCFSAGTLNGEQIRRLKEAGFNRLHCNLETSESFFPKIVSTHGWRVRYETLLRAKGLGLETCSGGIFGLGETWEDRVDLALTLSKLEVDSIPLNFLIPIPGTPLEGQQILSPREALVTIAIFRFACPKAELRLAGGRERVLGDYLGMANFMVNAHMVGGYLTRAGRDPQDDRKMVDGIGLKLL